LDGLLPKLLKHQLCATTLEVTCSPVSSRIFHPEVAAAPAVANSVARQGLACSGMFRFANRSEPTQISSHSSDRTMHAARAACCLPFSIRLPFLSPCLPPTASLRLRPKAAMLSCQQTILPGQPPVIKVCWDVNSNFLALQSTSMSDEIYTTILAPAEAQVIWGVTDFFQGIR